MQIRHPTGARRIEKLLASEAYTDQFGPFDESDSAPTAPSLFPHLAVGGGYSTQFILLNVPPTQAQSD